MQSERVIEVNVSDVTQNERQYLWQSQTAAAQAAVDTLCLFNLQTYL